MTIILPIRMRSVGINIGQPEIESIVKIRDFCFPSEHGTNCERRVVFDIAHPETVPSQSLTNETIKRLVLPQNYSGSIFIDVGGPEFLETVTTKVATALSQVVVQIGMDCPNASLTIFMQRKHEVADRYLIMLEDLCSTRNAMIVYANTGEVFNADDDAKTRNSFAKQIIEWSSIGRASNEELLKQKLIRHRGYYSFGIAGETTVSVFDGSNCIGEISELILSRLDQNNGNFKNVNILVDDRRSVWLGAAARNAQIESYGKYSFFFASELDGIDKSIEFQAVLFSVLRSGKTAVDLIAKIEGQLSSELYCWALVSNERGMEEEGPFLKEIERENGKSLMICVEIVKNSQDDEVLSALWNSADSVTPTPAESIDLAAEFKSDEIWSLLIESGLEREKPVPPHRSTYEWVPNMERMIALHGPLLAGKIGAVLARQHRQDDHSEGLLIFIHPKEDAASMLVDYICRLMVKRSFAIERDLIELARISNSLNELRENITDQNLENIGSKLTVKQLSEHLLNLEGVQESLMLDRTYPDFNKLRVILIDEFSGTGETLYNLKRIAEWLGWKIRSKICPITMGKAGPLTQMIDHSFYTFGATPVRGATDA